MLLRIGTVTTKPLTIEKMKLKNWWLNCSKIKAASLTLGLICMISTLHGLRRAIVYVSGRKLYHLYIVLPTWD